MSLRERSIMILDALSTEHGPETFVSDGYAYYEDALGALIAFAREIRNEALEEAAKEAQGPDEGYLHGCPCRGRIRGLVTSSAKEESNG